MEFANVLNEKMNIMNMLFVQNVLKYIIELLGIRAILNQIGVPVEI